MPALRQMPKLWHSTVYVIKWLVTSFVIFLKRGVMPKDCNIFSCERLMYKYRHKHVHTERRWNCFRKHDSCVESPQPLINVPVGAEGGKKINPIVKYLSETTAFMAVDGPRMMALPWRWPLIVVRSSVWLWPVQLSSVETGEQAAVRMQSEGSFTSLFTPWAQVWVCRWQRLHSLGTLLPFLCVCLEGRNDGCREQFFTTRPQCEGHFQGGGGGAIANNGTHSWRSLRHCFVFCRQWMTIQIPIKLSEDVWSLLNVNIGSQPAVVATGERSALM